MKPKYKEYVKLNKNLLVSFTVTVIVSTIVADEFSEEESLVNSTITIIVDFVTYFSVFLSLFLFENRKKYKKNAGNTNTLKKDVLKVISSLGVAEIAYIINRWFWQYYFLNTGIEAYQASLISQVISFAVFLIITNVMMKITRF